MITPIKKRDYTDKSCYNNLCNLSEICVILLYDLIFLTFALIYLPYFLVKGKFHKGVWQRFGFCEAGSVTGLPVWIHAVSVGEVAAVKTLWARLRKTFPSKGIVVSTVTKAGNELARSLSDGKEAVIYLPLDISVVVNSFLRRLNPSALVITETEIWPNMIYACHRRSIPVILVNGRVSNKAFKRYSLARPLLRAILEKIDVFCVQTEEDKRRFCFLGAPQDRVTVAGNMKYDIAPQAAINTDTAAIKARLGVRAQERILVAGSTHKGEEEIILAVFRKLARDFKSLRLIIAPRHIERAADIKSKIDPGLNVTIIDKIGVLLDAYSIADCVFVGGSLVRHGGHNIIEPAQFSKPIIFGPYMFNFQAVASEFLTNQAAVMAKDAGALEANLRRILADPKEGQRLGDNARKVVFNNQGAVERCLGEIKGALKDV